MNTKRYWIKQNVDVNILKNFCYMFNHKKRQIKVRARQNKDILVADIVLDKFAGNKYILYGMYKEVLDLYVKHGRNYDYKNTKMWAFEWSVAPKVNKAQVPKRFNAFFNLFDSIKKSGYKRHSNKLVVLMDVRGLLLSREVRGERLSHKYFRINGMKRTIIARYLGIEKIPCRILKLRIIPI